MQLDTRKLLELALWANDQYREALARSQALEQAHKQSVPDAHQWWTLFVHLRNTVTDLRTLFPQDEELRHALKALDPAPIKESDWAFTVRLEASPKPRTVSGLTEEGTQPDDPIDF